MRIWIHGVIFHAKFFLVIVALLHGAKLSNSRVPVSTLSSSIMAKYGLRRWTHGVLFQAKFHLDWFTVHVSAVKNKFVYFQLQHSVVVPSSGAETKLNAGAQQQTIPYPTVSKSFLSSNGLMATLHCCGAFIYQNLQFWGSHTQPWTEWNEIWHGGWLTLLQQTSPQWCKTSPLWGKKYKNRHRSNLFTLWAILAVNQSLFNILMLLAGRQ